METYYNDRRLDIVFDDGRVDSDFPTIRVFESATTVDSSTGNLRERAMQTALRCLKLLLPTAGN